MSLEDVAKWVSKDARYKIIEVLVSTRSARTLASQLGVSHTVINKYLKRKTHPSDETLARALNIVEEYERKRILQIIIEDILEALTILVNEVKNSGDKDLLEYISSKLISVLEVIKDE